MLHILCIYLDILVGKVCGSQNPNNKRMFLFIHSKTQYPNPHVFYKIYQHIFLLGKLEEILTLLTLGCHVGSYSGQIHEAHRGNKC